MMNETRLLSPDRAARYLGLGSRWAIYRLIAACQLPAIKLAGKVRLDRADLDAFIERLKRGSERPPEAPHHRSVARVPPSLAPLGRRGTRRRTTRALEIAGVRAASGAFTGNAQ
jgi:excisionase family DNA binding protein